MKNDFVLQRLAGEMPPDLFGHQSIAALAHAGYRAADVRRNNHTRRAPQRMALAPHARRLISCHICPMHM